MSPGLRSRTGSRRRGKKSLAGIDTEYLDRVLETFSGYLAIDELYDGPFCVISVVDNRMYQRLAYRVLEKSPTKGDVRRFLREFAARLASHGCRVRGITTDGSSLYPQALAKVFPGVPHQATRELHRFGGPSGRNDPDYLLLGYLSNWKGKTVPTPLTPDEQYTHVSLWCLLAAPLIFSGDVTRLDDFTVGLLCNDEVSTSIRTLWAVRVGAWPKIRSLRSGPRTWRTAHARWASSTAANLPRPSPHSGRTWGFPGPASFATSGDRRTSASSTAGSGRLSPVTAWCWYE